MVEAVEAVVRTGAERQWVNHSCPHPRLPAGFGQSPRHSLEPNREFRGAPLMVGEFASLFFAIHFRGAAAWRAFVRQVKRVCA